jgi:uncharacterized protein (TIGR00369 family)
MTPEEKESWLERINYAFCDGVPHNRAIGLRVTDFADGECRCQLPYDEKLVGNPATGVLHGGVITALLDAACGAAVFIKLQSAMRIATLDLRIDYLKPATPGETVQAHATCYKITRHVAFTRAVAFHEDESDPIGTASGTFMIFDHGRSSLGEALRET